jgi:hypothetical protein
LKAEKENWKLQKEVNARPMFQRKLFPPSLAFLQTNTQVMLKLILGMRYSQFQELGDTNWFQETMVALLQVSSANVEIFHRTTERPHVLIFYKLIQDAHFPLAKLWKIHRNEFEKGRFQFGAPVVSLRVVYSFSPGKLRSSSFDQEESKNQEPVGREASGSRETTLPSSGLGGQPKRRGRSIDSVSDNSFLSDLQSTAPKPKRELSRRGSWRSPADAIELQNKKAAFKRDFKENQQSGLMFLNMRVKGDPQEQSVMSFSEQSSEGFGGLARRREAQAQ